MKTIKYDKASAPEEEGGLSKPDRESSQLQPDEHQIQDALVAVPPSSSTQVWMPRVAFDFEA